MCQEAFAKTIAVQQIEYLRRAYARATDQIGLADEASVEAGRAVYRTIFAKDATFAVTGPETSPLSADGPDGWVDVVLGALGPMGPTQHLIGTQIVDIESITFDSDCQVTGGRATWKATSKPGMTRGTSRCGSLSAPIWMKSSLHPASAGKSNTWNCGE